MNRDIIAVNQDNTYSESVTQFRWDINVRDQPLLRMYVDMFSTQLYTQFNTPGGILYPAFCHPPARIRRWFCPLPARIELPHSGDHYFPRCTTFVLFLSFQPDHFHSPGNPQQVTSLVLYGGAPGTYLWSTSFIVYNASYCSKA
jgi:hypothetical protein